MQVEVKEEGKRDEAKTSEEVQGETRARRRYKGE